MALVDSTGRQVTPDVSKFIPMIIQDMRNMAQAIGSTQHAILMQEIKVNFLVGLLQEADAIPTDLDERWRTYAQTQLDKARAEAEGPQSVLDENEVPLPDLFGLRESAEVKV
jgi:hypothetical protein